MSLPSSSTAPIDSRGIYTPMTRGRETNHAYLVTEDNQTAGDLLTRAISRDWIDQPAIARQAQLDLDRSRPTALARTLDEAYQLERRVRPLIEQRLMRTREVQHTTGRALDLALDR